MKIKGFEIENFKSYAEKQYIHFSDLSVFLGANSSGKSTALQALLALKQTMECNSPDEELLLSGKYVVLGDYDDVITNPEVDSFMFSAIVDQTEKSEMTFDENDEYKISWCFTKSKDGISALLKVLDIFYENMHLSLKRADNELHYLYINEKRSPISVKVNNLRVAKYIIHYDADLNLKMVELLNELLEIFISTKVSKFQNDKPVKMDTIAFFYSRILNSESISDIISDNKKDEISKLAKNITQTIDTFCKMILPRYTYSGYKFPEEICNSIIELAIMSTDSLDTVRKVLLKYEDYLKKYTAPEIEDLEGIFEAGTNTNWMSGIDSEKEDNTTQLRYALDFYNQFYNDIISEIFFVGPIRESPKGLYNIGFETIPKYVGTTGAYFASVLLHESRNEREYILPHGREMCTLTDALAIWMMHLNIANAVNVDKKNSFGFSVSVENLEQIKSDIMNVGIGTSQVLPVLITMLLSEPNEILVFEQPELHLHPYSQSRLADLFIAFCMQGRRVILETHSEYFLLRLRYHVVKENISANLIAVNFFQNAKGTKVKRANISKLGNLEYPEDFKDETQELLNAILEAALERKGLS